MAARIASIAHKIPSLEVSSRSQITPRGDVRESTKDRIMTLYLSQRCWGRSCLHLAAALRAGHWRWHLVGISREIHFTRPLTLKSPVHVYPERRLIMMTDLPQFFGEIWKHTPLI